MKKRKTRSKRRRGTFSGLGGVSGSYEKVNMLHGHYLGMVQGVIRGERQNDDEPFIAIRHAIIKTFDDGQSVAVQGREIPHLKPGATPAHIIIKTSKFDYHKRDLKNFMMCALEQDDESVAEVAGKLWDVVQAEGELPEELSEYEDYLEDVESYEHVVDAVWDHMTNTVCGDEQPLAGALIEWASTSKIKKKCREVEEKNLDFTEHYVTNTVYKNAVSYSDAVDILSEEEMKVMRFYLPDIDDRVAAEVEGDEE